MKNRFFLFIMMISIVIGLVACVKCSKEIPASAEVKQLALYPAYTMEGSVKKWGYIDGKGTYIIAPKYEGATDYYNNGMAVVLENGVYKMIDQAGKSYMTSQYLNAFNFSESTIVVSDQSGISYLLDKKGQILFQTEGSIDKLSCGLAAFTQKASEDKYASGYINEKGKVVIEANYQWAQKFSEDKAIVQISEEHFGIIDKEGTLIRQLDNQRISGLSEDIFAFSASGEGNRQVFGYMTIDGKVMLDAIYTDAQEFKDGLAIVNAAEDFGNEYGVIDKTGKYMIPPKYAQITDLGNGIYAVPKGQDLFFSTGYIQKALFDKTGKQLTEFKYYDLERQDNGLISATDDKNTYLIDDNGKEAASITRAEGIGKITPFGSIYKVEVDNRLFYITQAGSKIWEADDTLQFADGLTVKTQTFRPDRCMLIQYPEVAGLSDIKVQDKINMLLKDQFVGDHKSSNKEDELYTETIDINFTADKNKDLLIISKNGYYYPIGAAHGQPIREDYHIDIKTGNMYTLSELFKEGSNYKDRLVEEIVRVIDKINEEYGEEIYSREIGDFEEYSGFVLQKDALKIYFYPYAIAPYAAGFPEFEIRYDELEDIINTSGELWNTFERHSVEDRNIIEIDSNEKAKIEETMKNYENNLIEAINQNNFELVEPWLYPESSLYAAQRKLVEDLNQKQIKERLDNYIIEKIVPDDLGMLYRVYVTENIGIQYPGKDETIKQFHWVYSLRYDYNTKQYQLTYIDDWSKK